MVMKMGSYGYKKKRKEIVRYLGILGIPSILTKCMEMF